MRITGYTNEDKKTCVVVIDKVDRTIIHKMRKISIKHGDKVLMRNQRNYYLADKYVGKAKCHPDDEWNPLIGLELAETRAMEKYKNACEKTAAKVLDEIYKVAYDVAELAGAAATVEVED